jgi:hypothetical protein
MREFLFNPEFSELPRSEVFREHLNKGSYGLQVVIQDEVVQVI